MNGNTPCCSIVRKTIDKGEMKAAFDSVIDIGKLSDDGKMRMHMSKDGSKPLDGMFTILKDAKHGSECLPVDLSIGGSSHYKMSSEGV